jgi:hypothetical protein
VTVFDASLTLFEWFKENDTFSVKSDFKGAFPISLDEEKDKAVVMASLKDMVNAEMLAEGEADGSPIWLLKRKLDQMNQSVEITYNTASEVALLVNTFCDVSGMGQFSCDPSEIKEADIKSLCFVAQTMAATQENLDEGNE